MRGAGPREVWQVICADCGPLQTSLSHDDCLTFGRTHLARTHMGGRMATGMGPFHEIEPEFGDELTQAIDELAVWFERQNAPEFEAEELVALCQTVLMAAGHARAARRSASG